MIQNSVNKPKKDSTNQLSCTALGIAGGAGAGFALRKGVEPLKKPYFKTFSDTIDKFTPQEHDALIQEANRMIEEAAIKAKGFNGINWIDITKKRKVLSTEDILKSSIEEQFKKELSQKSITEGKAKDLWKTIRNEIERVLEKLDPPNQNASAKISASEAIQKLEAGLLKKILNGKFTEKLVLSFLIMASPLAILAELLTGKPIKKNKQLAESVSYGCFDPLSNRIFTGKPASVLHEIGHAINKNSNFMTRLPHNLTIISRMALIPLAILTAIFTKKPKKTQGEETNNKTSWQKFKEFVHNHIGLTVAGLSIPLLVEEGLASARAIKFANASKTLSETVKNQHNKLLKIAYGSYLIGTAVIASAASLTVYTKDKIVDYFNKK